MISGIEADYDGEEMTFDNAVEIAEKGDLACIIYTSPSHNITKPRWRVLCPSSRELPPSDRAVMMARLNGLYGGIFADESFTLSQSYYFGHIAGSRDHRVELIDGTCIDLLDELDEIAIGKPNGGGNGHAPNGHSRPIDEAALSEDIVSGKTYHRSAIRLVGYWAMLGVPLLDAKARLEALFDSVPEDKRDQKWRARRRDIKRSLDYVYGKEAGKEDEAATDDEKSTDDDWYKNCLLGSKKQVLGILANATLAFRRDPAWQGVLAFDEMQRAAILRKPIPQHGPVTSEAFRPRPIQDDDVAAAQEWLQLAGLRTIGADTTHSAIHLVARENSFHPIRDYLDGLVWDGFERLTTWLHQVPWRREYGIH